MRSKAENGWVFTPHIRTHADAKDTLTLYQAILESIQDGVSVLSADLSILYMNTAMRKWYEGGNFSGKCYRVYHGRGTPCDDCPTLKAVASRRPESAMVSYTRNGRDRGYQQLYAIPVYGPEGRLRFVVEYIRDITPQLKILQDLEQIKTRFSQLEDRNTILMDLLEHLLKTIKPSNETDPIKSLLEHIVSPARLKSGGKFERLTPREYEVALLLKEGLTSKEIAARLNITPKTIDFHRGNVRKKLGLSGQNGGSLRGYLNAHM